MKALLWKDVQVNRMILIVGATLLLTPYLIAVAYCVYHQWPELPKASTWSQVLVGASAFSLALSQLTVVMLGGNAIAAERADRSAEFLAYLPPSRAQVIASKVVVTLAAVAVIWGGNLLAADLVAPALSDGWRELAMELPPRDILTAKGVLLFGAAWLASSFLSSPALAIGFGFAVYAVTALAVQAMHHFLGWPPEGQVLRWYLGMCLVLGPLCFAAGTAYFLRRVEP